MERLRWAHNGDQFNWWQQRWLMNSHELQLSFFNYTWNDCYFESTEGFCVTAAHTSDAAAGTCCHPSWCQLSQPWTSVLVKAFLGDLLSYKETEPASLLFSERWCQAATLPRANNLVHIDKCQQQCWEFLCAVLFSSLNSKEEIDKYIKQIHCF